MSISIAPSIVLKGKENLFEPNGQRSVYYHPVVDFDNPIGFIAWEIKERDFMDALAVIAAHPAVKTLAIEAEIEVEGVSLWYQAFHITRLGYGNIAYSLEFAVDDEDGFHSFDLSCYQPAAPLMTLLAETDSSRFATDCC